MCREEPLDILGAGDVMGVEVNGDSLHPSRGEILDESMGEHAVAAGDHDGIVWSHGFSLASTGAEPRASSDADEEVYHIHS